MALRQLLFSRCIHTCRALRASMAEPLAAQQSGGQGGGHGGAHADSYKKWKTLFFIGCCPCILVGYVSIALEDPPERPEYIEYPYMRIRNKKFPWRDGVQTPFHNPYYNAVPGGYETDIPPHHQSWVSTLLKGSKH